MKLLSGKELLNLLRSVNCPTMEAKELLSDMEADIENLNTYDALYYSDNYCLYSEQDEIDHPRAIEGDYDTTRLTGKRSILWVMDLMYK